MAGTVQVQETRTRTMRVRLTDAEHRQLDKEARRTGLSRSDLMRLGWRAYLNSKERVA